MSQSIPHEVVLKMIEDHKQGTSCRTLEKEYGYSRKLISKILKDSGEKIIFRYTDNILQRASELIQQGKSLRQTALQLNIDRDQLARQLQRLGVRDIVQPARKDQQFQETEETIKVRDLYLSGLSIQSITDRMGYASTNIVYRILEVYGVTDHDRLAKTYELEDNNIFHIIDTEEKAYWLGFLMADCYMDDLNGKYSIEFMLAEKDRERVEAFARFMNSKVPLHVHNRIINGYNQVKVCINNKQVFQDLLQHGCVPRKSLTKTFPWHIPQEMYCHFLRGYFDGNGCIACSKNKFQVQIASSERMCKGIESLLIKESIIYRRCKIFRSGQAWIFQRGGNIQVQKIFHYLYDNATEYMQRKFVKFNAVLEQ